MDTCDVLIVGGGPAGSACARELRRRGLDVLVMDQAQFPRDKVCAGWITPPVVASLELDVDDYRRGRTLQPFTGFRIGLIGVARAVDVTYGEPVSYGIRRCEFDDYLLRRAAVRVRLGQPVAAIERRDGRWIVNGDVAAPMIVGAGGHRCPVARLLNPSGDRSSIVQAMEIEYPVAEDSHVLVRAGSPELYFSRDLAGYGWCLRKGAYLNVGFGRLTGHALRRETSAFISFLTSQRRAPAGIPSTWRAHAYRLSSERRPRVVGDGALLIGDAAGLAAPRSGEGIRQAIESGLLAAAAIVEARERYTIDRLTLYEGELRSRFNARTKEPASTDGIFTNARAALVRSLMTLPWFARRVIIDECFLQRRLTALRSPFDELSPALARDAR